MSNIFTTEFGIPQHIVEMASKVEATCKPLFDEVDKIKEQNQLKVLSAFMHEEVAPAHFAASYGYGYDDIGRDKLASLFARIFKAEAAIVRPQIASGTHALALGLQGIYKRISGW